MLYLPKNHTQRRLFHEKYNTGHQVLSISSFLRRQTRRQAAIKYRTYRHSSTVCKIAMTAHPNPSPQSHAVHIITPTNTQMRKSPSFVGCINVTPMLGWYTPGFTCTRKVIPAPSQVFTAA